MQNLRGFSLMEMLFALAMVSLLLMLGLPSYQTWIQNTKIRTAAESIFNGMQLAKAEAIRRNVNVGFYLVDSMTSSCQADGTSSNWIVSLQNPNGSCNAAPSDSVAPQIIQKRDAAEGATEGLVIISAPAPLNATPDQIVFTPLGRGNSSGTQFSQIDVSFSPAVAGIRPLRVQIGVGGSIKMCDPNALGSDPRRC